MDPVRFENPPVVEVACGASFVPPTNFRAAHVGLFWQTIRKAFPTIEEVQPLVDLPSYGGDGFPIGLFALPWPRTWISCPDRSALIQIQKDRFIYNWKRVQSDRAYPSFVDVFGEFRRHFANFQAFVKSEIAAELQITQLELTYVNHIELSVPNVANVFVDHVRAERQKRYLPSPSRFQWASVYSFPDGAGELTSVAQVARSVLDGSDLLRLDMSAKGLGPFEADHEGWFELAHQWITQGFVDMTDEAIQKNIWRRTS